jgi:hypothetical protein
MGLAFEVCHVDCTGYYCCRRFHFSDRCQSRLKGFARRMGMPGSAEVRDICVANRLRGVCQRLGLDCRPALRRAKGNFFGPKPFLAIDPCGRRVG